MYIVEISAIIVPAIIPDVTIIQFRFGTTELSAIPDVANTPPISIDSRQLCMLLITLPIGAEKAKRNIIRRSCLISVLIYICITY